MLSTASLTHCQSSVLYVQAHIGAITLVQVTDVAATLCRERTPQHSLLLFSQRGDHLMNPILVRRIAPSQRVHQVFLPDTRQHPPTSPT